MPDMRAKMRLSHITKLSEGGQEQLHFFAVGPSKGYPEDGSDENNSYAKWSPSGLLQLQVANPALIGKFEVGQEFYIDFTLAPGPAAAKAA